MAAPTATTGWGVGGRVVVDAVDVGTIRWVGSLPGMPSSSSYLGIEWDHECRTRGTHCGVYKDMQVFTVRRAAHNATASFLRINGSPKDPVVAPASTVAQAIVRRYGPPSAPPPLLPSFALTVSAKQVPIQLVGMEQVEQLQHDFSRLQTACISHEMVASFDSLHLATQFPLLSDLDASHNILAALPNSLPSSLVSLNLSFNRLYLDEPDGGAPCVNDALGTLAVTNTGIQWPQLERFLASAPQLHSLDVSGNITLCRVPASICVSASRLTHVYMGNCGIEDWLWLQPLSALPSLTHLFVSENPFTSVSITAGSFAKLRVLAVAQTGVTMSFVEALQALSSLRHLRYADTPAHKAPQSRLTVIGELPQLTELNGGEIGARERADAEIYAQRRRQGATNGGTSSGNAAKVTLPKLPDLFVRFSCGAAGVLLGSNRTRVSPQTTIAMVRDIAFTKTQIKPFRQYLWARKTGDLESIPLDQDHTLEWYGFLQGDVDIVVSEDPA